MSKFIHYFPFTIFTFLVLGFSTTDIWGVSLLPGVAFAWIFHWTLYRPNQLFALPMVLVGTVYDIIVDNPMGLSPLFFLLSYITLLYLRARIFHLPFKLIWGVFTVFASLCGILYWITFCALSFLWVYPAYITTSFIWVMVTYPFLSRIMISLQRRYYG